MAEVGAAGPRPVPDQRPILVVDFDGTVYRGDAPVRYYARRIAEALPRAVADRYLDAFEAYLARGVAAADGESDPATAKLLRDAEDGWHVAQTLAWELHGTDRADTQRAFVATREWMLTPDCELEVVRPLTGLLAELVGGVRVVLATNSPAEGLVPLLDRLGVTGLFTQVLPGARKPEGLRRWIGGELAGGRDPGELFSIGDHYRNEIEPAMAVGARAGYIDRFGRADGPATATAGLAEELVPAIRAWAVGHD